MYYLCGMQEVCKIIGAAIEFDVSVNNIFISDEIPTKYHYFLNKTSVFDDIISWKTTKIMNFEAVKAIVPAYFSVKRKFFCDNSSLLEERLANGYFQSAMAKLQLVAPELYALSQLIIKIIIVNHLHKYTNGTSQEAIGLAAIDFRDEFDMDDFIELIIHQLTHMLLFIDHHSDLHIPDECREMMIPTTLKYKLGGTDFPAYLAFHSYIVGVEVLQFRRNIFGLKFKGKYHGETSRMVKVCREFKASLSAHLDLFTPRGIYLYEQAAGLLSKLEISV